MELNELVKHTVKQVINEIAGANNSAISTINELIEKIDDYKNGYTNSNKFIINAPYGGIITVILCDDKYFKNESTCAQYNHTARTIYIRASRINGNDWKLKIKSDLIHELTHNIQRSNEPLALMYKRRKYQLGKPVTELANKISYIFDDDEISARVSEAYYEFTETIRYTDINIAKSHEFKEYVFNHSETFYSYVHMLKLIIDVIETEPTEKNIQQLIDIGLSINNKSNYKTVNRSNNIMAHISKQCKIEKNIKNIDNEKNILRRIINSILNKKIKYNIEYTRQNKLLNNEINELKKMIVKILRKKADNYKNKINKAWEYLVTDYSNNHGHFSNDITD